MADLPAQGQAIERNDDAVGSIPTSSMLRNPNKINASQHHEPKQN
jgi:hypothetical protein